MNSFCAIVGLTLFVFLTKGFAQERHEIENAWAKTVSSLAKGTQGNNSCDISWFLGFVEGNTGIEPPAFWATAAKTLSSDRIINTLEISIPYHESSGVRCPTSTRIARQQDDLEIIQGEERFLFNKQSDVNGLFLNECLSVASNKSCIFLANHSNRSEKYKLICMDKITKNTRWTAFVCPRNQEISYTGKSSHFVHISLSEDFIIVFGLCSDLLYISCMDAITGNCKWRISTEE